jgi:murein DD-endopeptidase MepM/ murein hydrolase activator NlpD
LLAALALATYLVQPGDTLSGIAYAHGSSLAAVESANPQIANPNLIYIGQSISLPSGASATVTQSAPSYQSPSSTTSSATTTSTTASTTATSAASSSSAASGYDSSSLSDIPGVPSSFAACVAYRESTDLENPAADGNAYGILPSSGYDVEGASLAAQKQAFSELYAQYGTQPWAPSDGC